MQIADIANRSPVSGISVLRTANEQPKLAGELISMTIENMRNQKAQTPAQPAGIPDITGRGTIINTTA